VRPSIDAFVNTSVTSWVFSVEVSKGAPRWSLGGSSHRCLTWYVPPLSKYLRACIPIETPTQRRCVDYSLDCQSVTYNFVARHNGIEQVTCFNIQNELRPAQAFMKARLHGLALSFNGFTTQDRTCRVLAPISLPTKHQPHRHTISTVHCMTSRPYIAQQLEQRHHHRVTHFLA
jgi:hypothetical protein